MTALRQAAWRLMDVSLAEQHRWYASVLLGHYGYYGWPHGIATRAHPEVSPLIARAPISYRSHAEICIAGMSRYGQIVALARVKQDINLFRIQRKAIFVTAPAQRSLAI